MGPGLGPGPKILLFPGLGSGPGPKILFFPGPGRARVQENVDLQVSTPSLFHLMWIIHDWLILDW